MNVIRKVTGILLALFVITVPIWLSTDMAKITSSGNGRLPVGAAQQIDDQKQDSPNTNTSAIVGTTVSFQESIAVRDLVPQPDDPEIDREINPRENPFLLDTDMGRRGTWDRANVPTDPLIATSYNTESATPPIDFSFDATGNPTGCGGCSPPDVTGDVGPNHYVHMVNATKVAIFDKTGTPLNTPYNLGNLWSTGNCTGNAGDPIVVYDPLADRWLLTQFASPNHMCLAVSQTPDPLGSFYLYEFNVQSFPDYFKFGVWPDGYYMSANESSYTAYAFDRAKMLVGDPTATFQKFTGQNNFLLPSDIDGNAAPPANSPNYFYTFKDDSYHGNGADRLEVFEFDTDWTTPANTTFIRVDTINIAPFTYTACGFFNFNCIYQQGTTQRFDSLGEWPLFRFPYRNFGSHETLVGTFDVGGGLGQAGSAIRWFELRKNGGNWTLYQEGTHDPNDGHDRVNASIAMDGAGNIALGYTVSSGTMYPSIRYATRNAGDPLGTLQTEATIIDGGGSQTGSSRWGDYSTMSVDPANDCSFWYTNEYYTSSSSSTWSTHVGVFTVPGCTSSTFLMQTTPAAQNICAPNDAVYTIDVTAAGGFTGDVALVASGEPGTATFTPNTVTTDGSSALVISGATVGNYTFDIIGTGVTTPSLMHTNTVTLDVFAAAPAATTLLLPANTASSIPTTPAYSWNPVADAISYDIQIATDAGFSNIVDSANVDTNAYASGVTLDAGTTYYWRVRANNGCGTGSYSTTFSFTTSTAPGVCEPGTTANTLYSEDFEGGTDIWAHGGAGDTWTMSTARPNSGSYSYYAQNVGAVSNQQLESPDVVLPSDNLPLSLQFWNWQTIEDGCYDGAIAEISTDSGSTWTQLESELLTDPYDNLISDSYGNPLGGLNGWCGDPQDWLNSVVDLNAYAGETVRFRFSLGTDSSVSREGWYIDDFKVQSCVSGTPVLDQYIYLPAMLK